MCLFKIIFDSDDIKLIKKNNPIQDFNVGNILLLHYNEVLNSLLNFFTF